jgi:hypothetical protein
MFYDYSAADDKLTMGRGGAVWEDTAHRRQQHPQIYACPAVRRSRFVYSQSGCINVMRPYTDDEPTALYCWTTTRRTEQTRCRTAPPL